MQVVYLDPHTTQAAPGPDSSYHAPRPARLPVSQLDPSLALAFLATSEAEFDNLCIDLQARKILEMKIQ